MRSNILVATLALSLSVTTLEAQQAELLPSVSDPGISPGSVEFVQIAALEGPAAALGRGMRLGIGAAFNEINASGGVHGRKLVLDSRDDGYSPQKSVQILDDVIAGNAHFGLIGSVGTPTAAAMQPKVKAADLPMIGPFTGASFLRDTSNGPIMNVRATYAAETEAWMAYLVDQKGYNQIAILYQDDGFGRVGLAGARAALEKRGMELVAEGTYTRNSRAVKEALLELRDAEPQAVVMVGAYKPIAEFIRWARKLEFEPDFVNISFVGSASLAAELGQDGEGVIVSQVVPFPWDETIPLVARYQRALASFDSAAEPGFVSLEGYLVGRLAIEALDAAGRNLTRDGFMDAFFGLGAHDFGGVGMTFSEGDNQGMDDVFLTHITASGDYAKIE
ncbi:MAG: ABC transporter substrate-binding protein [Pseudomonadota bacterium]